MLWARSYPVWPLDVALRPFCRRSPLVSLSLELCPLEVALQHCTVPARMQVECGSWIRWLGSRTRSCADNLGSGKEIDKVRRTAKRSDDDGDSKDVGLRPLLLAAVIMAARALPPQTNRRRMTKEKKHWAKILAALCRVRIRSSTVFFQPMNSSAQGAGCRVCFVFICFNLTQPWNFLHAPLGSTVAFTASTCLRPRPLRAYAEPQAGISPPRRISLVFNIILTTMSNSGRGRLSQKQNCCS